MAPSSSQKQELRMALENHQSEEPGAGDEDEGALTGDSDEERVPRSSRKWLGGHLRKSRIRSALSQSELGTKMDVSQATVSAWETGRSEPTASQKAKLRAILGGFAASWERIPREGSADGGPAPLGGWLTKARLLKGLSVPELAQSAGLSTTAIYHIESGRIMNPRSETVRRLEAALGGEVPSDALDEIRKEAEIEGFGELIDFDPHSDDELPAVPGIYVLYDVSERPIYVGQGGDIKRRIRSHRDKFWFKQPIVHTGAYVHIGEQSLRERVEKLLIRFLKSNAVINQQNVDRD